MLAKAIKKAELKGIQQSKAQHDEFVRRLKEKCVYAVHKSDETGLGWGNDAVNIDEIDTGSHKDIMLMIEGS